MNLGQSIIQSLVKNNRRPEWTNKLLFFLAKVPYYLLNFGTSPFV